PKTQSALLESMAEQQVTIDTTTYPLTAPFMVIATQNPIELDGTHPLPEAQRDRFTARISIGYPTQHAELAMVDDRAEQDPAEALTPVTDAEGIRELIAAVQNIHMSPEIRRYAVELVAATRTAAEVALGASPRATLQLVRAARAHAALSERTYVIPDDLRTIAVPVLAHRLVLSNPAQADHHTAADVITRIVTDLPVPHGRGDGRDSRTGDTTG